MAPVDILSQETIVAPATAMGEGGVGIIRLSGNAAERTLSRLFRPTRPVSRFKSHRLYHGRIYDNDQVFLDEVMAVVMRQPHSYTREDVVEIHCHGGTMVLRRILDLLVDSGLRLARPGEFTLRAFLNGRIDLAEAEGVIDLIRARSESACSVALQQMEGGLSRAIYRFRDGIMNLLAEIEAQVDFPDEDLDFQDQGRILQAGQVLMAEMDALLATFDSGRVLREGLSILILGRPNVGKSSLLNALLGESRAIVTTVPGTTRDTLEESFVLGGIPLRIVDTAGVRITDDPVEAEGVRRARARIPSADLILLVVDGSLALTEEDHGVLSACYGRNLLLVVNKGDLEQTPLTDDFAALPQVRLSAHTGEGLELLRDTVVSRFLCNSSGEGRESILLSDRRHREALVRARGALGNFSAAVERQAPGELLSVDLREALQSLGEITGETTPEAILEMIFSKFCIGK